MFPYWQMDLGERMANHCIWHLFHKTCVWNRVQFITQLNHIIIIEYFVEWSIEMISNLRFGWMAANQCSSFTRRYLFILPNEIEDIPYSLWWSTARVRNINQMKDKRWIEVVYAVKTAAVYIDSGSVFFHSLRRKLMKSYDFSHVVRISESTVNR